MDTLAANVSSYSDTSVSNLTSYDYRVRAIKGATASGYSNTGSATTPDQPVGGGISLSASGFKVKGKHNVDLSWSDSSASNVDIYRDGNLIMTTANDDFYSDNIGSKGGATYRYEVCDAGTSNCSNTATVVFEPNTGNCLATKKDCFRAVFFWAGFYLSCSGAIHLIELESP